LAKSGICTHPEKADAYLCDAANLEECKAQCAKGDGPSCYNVAANRISDYKQRPNDRANADGRNADLKDESTFLEKSCSLGYAVACAHWAEKVKDLNLGDLGQVTKLFTQACSAGEGLGCLGLASMYIGGWPGAHGDGIKKDQRAARTYSERACSLGKAYGCRDVSCMAAQGVGGSKDPAVATKFMTRCSDVGVGAKCTCDNVRFPSP
jgi:TPR repeat protein